MKNWARTRLGEHIQVRHGFAFQGKYFSDRGKYIVLTPGNFIDAGGFKPKSGVEKFYSVTPPSEYVLQRGDLVVAMTEQVEGLLGSSVLVPDDDTYLHNQRIGLVILQSDQVDRGFLYYLFNTTKVRDQIQATATGSKIRHTAPSRIEDVVVDLPPISTQRKIAAILSAYDDLIENNNRRIKLLEEMAQRIYREWFVGFRYPGHEGVLLVNSALGSIPKGWSVDRLGDEVELVYGKALKSESRRPGVVTVFGSGGPIGMHDEALGDGPTVIVGRKGNVGAVYWSDGPFFAIDTTYWVRSELPMTYCFYVLRDARFLDSHVAVPGLSREQAYSLPIVVPNADVLDKFESMIRQTFSLRRHLEDANTNLRVTRDLLLLRLVSGEIDVTDLDIAVAETAA